MFEGLSETMPGLQGLSSGELREALALGLYADWKKGEQEAAGVAGLSVTEFQMLLRKRAIPRHYTREELARKT